MNRDELLFAYSCRLGDNALILGQRMVEQVAALPDLEEELANANFALDYLGHARMFYTHAAEVEGKGRNEDDLALLRDEREFRNFLLVELNSRHFGDHTVRQVFFELFYLAQLEALCQCEDAGLVAVAERAVKEVRYHLRHNSQWLLRLGDGTEESHRRAQDSVDRFWRFTGEMFEADALDTEFARQFHGPNLADIRASWAAEVDALLGEATLRVPGETFMASGGKRGVHSEEFGYLIAEMQHLRRSHPEATW